MHRKCKRWCRAVAPRTRKHHRKDLCNGRLGVTTFAQCITPAQCEQAAAALAHEFGEHAQLITREESGFDAAENDCAILEELFALDRKSTDQLEAVLHAKTQVLAICAPHEANHLKTAVFCYRAPQEGEFRARLTFY